MAIGGAVLMYVYKAVNTMDSMLGYKNDNYFYFGKAAAKADDVFNFIPSRLSALCMIFAAFVIRLDWKNAAKVFKRDRFKHASPNSAQTEAVAAGALDVMLAGDAYYFGELYHKETIGDDLRQVEISDIRTMNRLMYVSALSALIIFGGVKLCICMAAMFTAM
jgi:adenosylcobinamide-phosphate synthase